MIDFREVVWTVSLRKAVHRAVTKNNSCILRVMPRFERPTCREAENLWACLEKWDCLELEWSTWQCCLSRLFPVKIRVTVKQAQKSSVKSGLWERLWDQFKFWERPSCYSLDFIAQWFIWQRHLINWNSAYPSGQMTVLTPCYNLSALVPSLPMSLSRTKTSAKTK